MELSAERKGYILNDLEAFLERELEKVQSDRTYIQENIADEEKKSARLSYQNWREGRLTNLLAMLTLLR